MSKLTLIAVVWLGLFHIAKSIVLSRDCTARDYGNGGTVCVCSEKHCDTFEPIKKTSPGLVTLYESNSKGNRFRKSILKFEFTEEKANLDNINARYGKRVIVERAVRHQSIIGFGGAFTDAAGINILKLPSQMAKQIIADYYSSNGLDYTVGRIPIGGSDFSVRKYTYDDQIDDFNLTSFRLPVEDLTYKMPLIRFAQAISKHELKLIASPWSAPAWMKTNNDLKGRGRLIGEPGGKYYKTWANYLVKFLDAYKSNGVPIWGLTTQNEPTDGLIPWFTFNCMGFTPQMMRDFIKLDLGPALAAANYGPDQLKLIIMDDQLLFVQAWADAIYRDSEAARYVSGLGFHWYLNNWSPLIALDETIKTYPNYFLLATEACEGSSPFDFQKVSLGNWKRAESYANDIITDLQHHTSGWIDWNLALDLQGGPNWAKNFVDSPIIVNTTGNEYYKQPMYYSLAHFTRFLPPSSVRIGTDEEGVEWLQTVVFITPENATVVIVVNTKDEDVALTIVDIEIGGKITRIAEAHSFQTFIWWN